MLLSSQPALRFLGWAYKGEGSPLLDRPPPEFVGETFSTVKRSTSCVSTIRQHQGYRNSVGGNRPARSLWHTGRLRPTAAVLSCLNASPPDTSSIRLRRGGESFHAGLHQLPVETVNRPVFCSEGAHQVSPSSLSALAPSSTGERSKTCLALGAQVCGGVA